MGILDGGDELAERISFTGIASDAASRANKSHAGAAAEVPLDPVVQMKIVIPIAGILKDFVPLAHCQ